MLMTKGNQLDNMYGMLLKTENELKLINKEAKDTTAHT